MGEVELLQILRETNAAIAGHYAQVISITFAMVVAIFYFLNRSGMALKVLAFVVYLVGMFMFIGLMLEESNFKQVALDQLAALPRASLSGYADGVLQLQRSWLFTATSVLLNAGLWLMIGANAWMLFVWRRPDHAPTAGDSGGEHN